ncbi:MAG: ankyrin repeat domain-containing protein [Bryobacteraceae bacterium]|jgi:N-acyl-D-amino-acid deacylase
MSCKLRFLPLLLASLVCAAENPGERLLAEIRKGDIAAVRSLLAHGADVNARDAKGATALMYAAIYGDVEFVNLLLDKGADPNASNDLGIDALMWAASDLVKVRTLVAHGANVKARSNYGYTALSVASASPGNIATVRLLLEKGADVKAIDKDGVGPLWLACARGDSQIAEELLRRGADPNEKHLRLTETALMWASKMNRPPSVEALLKAGADVNQRSAIRVPAQSGQQEVGKTSALLWAAPRNDPEAVKLLLNAHADPNAVDMRGLTPLMLAVTNEDQNLETVRMLLEKTSDINHRDENRLTALDWARKWGSTPITRLLETAGVQSSPPPDPQPAPRLAHFEIREAIEKSAALLLSSSPKFFEKTGCVGCHHHMLTGMLIGIARERGFRVDEKAAAEQIKMTVARRLSDREPTLVARNKGGYPMLDSLFLVSLAAQKYPADALMDADVHSLMAAQREDGSWQGVDRRPPLQYSPVSDTAYAVRAIQQYALPGRSRETAQRIERAQAWLIAVEPKHNEERVMQLLGLAWSHADKSTLRKRAEHLLAQQQPDGGWAQRTGFPSDAYATGQALYALHEAVGLAASNAAYQRGVKYLLDTQFEDGSWHVVSRSVKFQPYFESGFPHSHDQWISSAGTAWAAIALALTLPQP